MRNSRPTDMSYLHVANFQPEIVSSILKGIIAFTGVAALLCPLADFSCAAKFNVRLKVKL